MTTKEQIKAIIKQYADKGKTQYRECCDDNESALLINYWDGYRDCAYNLLRELEDMQEEPTTSVWHSAKDEEPIKGREIVVLTSVCNIADKNISFTGEYIGNGYIQAFNAKEYINSWAKWAYRDDLLKL